MDWDSRVATFQSAQKASLAVKYDLLVVCDGRHSKTRSLYQQHDPSFTAWSKPARLHYMGFSGVELPGQALEHIMQC